MNYLRSYKREEKAVPTQEVEDLWDVFENGFSLDAIAHLQWAIGIPSCH